MDDAQMLSELKEKVNQLEERIRALEKEQRNIREDILLGKPKERMQKRILDKPNADKDKLKEKIDEKIKIEI